MKCLLVDDEPGIREGLAALLRRKGHDVRTAADCAGAAAALAGERFDVVVSDWRLPDGLAAEFVVGCPSPVLAVSGHPEEVSLSPSIVAVLTKPVLPSRLLEAMAAVGAPGPANGEPDRTPLPRDAQAVVDTLLAALPPTLPVELHDDGTFVAVRVDLSAEQAARLRLPADLPGDPRLLRRGERRVLELRICRDGRPRADLPVVPFGAEWPSVPELAVDLHERAVDATAFRHARSAAAALLAAGRRVHFLNVPPALVGPDSGQATAHDMPMRDPVGPCVQAELADLWSQS
jgi:CheY-like chemotaxis protein